MTGAASLSYEYCITNTTFIMYQSQHITLIVIKKNILSLNLLKIETRNEVQRKIEYCLEVELDVGLAD